MISLRSILTLIVVVGSLLPAYWVGTSMIDKHQTDLLVQKNLNWKIPIKVSKKR